MERRKTLDCADIAKEEREVMLMIPEGFDREKPKTTIKMVVFLLHKGRPVSYKRIYETTYKKIRKFLDQLALLCYEKSRDKFTIRQLSEHMDLTSSEINHFTRLLAGSEGIYELHGKNYTLIHPPPLVILRQRMRHDIHKLKRMKTPVWIYPGNKLQKLIDEEGER